MSAKFPTNVSSKLYLNNSMTSTANSVDLDEAAHNANSVNLDEAAHYELPHLDLYCLQNQLFSSLTL